MTSPTPASPADNILILNTLKSSAPTILSSAGHAFSALTNAPLPSPPAPDQTALDAHKTVFRANTTTFFTLVKQLGDTLKEQAAALEEAGIIPAEAPRFGVSDGASAAGEVTNGGLGDLDVGWLNSRNALRAEEMLCEFIMGCAGVTIREDEQKGVVQSELVGDGERMEKMRRGGDLRGRESME